MPRKRNTRAPRGIGHAARSYVRVNAVRPRRSPIPGRGVAAIDTGDLVFLTIRSPLGQLLFHYARVVACTRRDPTGSFLERRCGILGTNWRTEKLVLYQLFDSSIVRVYVTRFPINY